METNQELRLAIQSGDMTDDNLAELDAIYAKLEKYEKALEDIQSAPHLYFARPIDSVKFVDGVKAGLRAGAKVAQNALMEDEAPKLKLEIVSK